MRKDEKLPEIYPYPMLNFHPKFPRCPMRIAILSNENPFNSDNDNPKSLSMLCKCYCLFSV